MTAIQIPDFAWQMYSKVGDEALRECRGQQDWGKMRVTMAISGFKTCVDGEQWNDALGSVCLFLRHEQRTKPPLFFICSIDSPIKFLSP